MAARAREGERLSQLLGRDVPLAKDVIGPDAHKLADELKDGDVMLIENVRFHQAFFAVIQSRLYRSEVL